MLMQSRRSTSAFVHGFPSPWLCNYRKAILPRGVCCTIRGTLIVAVWAGFGRFGRGTGGDDGHAGYMRTGGDGGNCLTCPSEPDLAPRL